MGFTPNFILTPNLPKLAYVQFLFEGFPKGKTCLKKRVDPELAQLHHFRKKCNRRLYSDEDCEKMSATIVKDTRVYLNLDNVIQNTNIALKNIIFDK